MVVGLEIRPARCEDYDPIVAVADEWWDRPIVHVLPRLFLDHFHRTSLIAEDDDRLVGFLVGFLSPSLHEEAYIHFVGVSPEQRRNGLARSLYERFFDLARTDGRTTVRAVTAPVNTSSIAFHRRMGFDVVHPVTDSSAADDNYVRFSRGLG